MRYVENQKDHIPANMESLLLSISKRCSKIFSFFSLPFVLFVNFLWLSRVFPLCFLLWIQGLLLILNCAQIYGWCCHVKLVLLWKYSYNPRLVCLKHLWLSSSKFLETQKNREAKRFKFGDHHFPLPKVTRRIETFFLTIGPCIIPCLFIWSATYVIA